MSTVRISTIRMVGPHVVCRALSCSRATAYEVMSRLGGGHVDGVGWRVSERKLLAYLRQLEAGELWNCTQEPSTENESTTPDASISTRLASASSDASQPASRTTDPRPTTRQLTRSASSTRAISRWEAVAQRANAARVERCKKPSPT